MKSNAFSPLVEIIIAVHQLNRPLDRAIASVLGATPSGEVRVLVVAHGLEVAAVQKLIPAGTLPFVTVIGLTDGIHSAAGPFNAGLNAATAEFVGVMGSDDQLADGALGSWIKQARSSGADAVLAPLRFQDGTRVRTPRRRPLSGTKLDPVRDRMAYRTAPLGLLRLATVRRLGLQFSPGLATGEDIGFSLQLWFTANLSLMGIDGADYIIGEDAVERVTHAILPLDQEFCGVVDVLTQPWFTALSIPERRAIAVKFARIHLIAALTRRGSMWAWSADDALQAKDLWLSLGSAAPGFERPLSRAERALLSMFTSPTTSSMEINLGLANYAQASRLQKLLTCRTRDNFVVESNIRYFLDLKIAKLRHVA